jgi:hypothetical protein
MIPDDARADDVTGVLGKNDLMDQMKQLPMDLLLNSLLSGNNYFIYIEMYEIS